MYIHHNPARAWDQHRVNDSTIKKLDDSKNVEGFHSHGGTPTMDGLIRENGIKMDDDWGYHYFSKPPYGLRGLYPL